MLFDQSLQLHFLFVCARYKYSTMNSCCCETVVSFALFIYVVVITYNSSENTTKFADVILHVASTATDAASLDDGIVLIAQLYWRLYGSLNSRGPAMCWQTAVLYRTPHSHLSPCTPSDEC